MEKISCYDTDSPETIICFHSLMKFPVDESIFTLDSNLQRFLFDVNRQHLCFQLTVWNPELVCRNNNLKVGKSLSPSVSICGTPVVHRFRAFSFPIIFFVVILFLFFFLFSYFLFGFSFGRSWNASFFSGSGSFLLGSPRSLPLLLLFLASFRLFSSLQKMLSATEPSRLARISWKLPFSYVQVRPLPQLSFLQQPPWRLRRLPRFHAFYCILPCDKLLADGKEY